MNRATSQMRAIAERLVSNEAPPAISGETDGPNSQITFSVCDKLRPPLATLMGNRGFCALLTRALELAKPENSFLGTAHVNSDGFLSGLDGSQRRPDPAQFAESQIVLLTNLIGLLVAFIGANLTSRLLNEVWPKILPADLDFGPEDKNEKIK